MDTPTTTLRPKYRRLSLRLLPGLALLLGAGVAGWFVRSEQLRRAAVAAIERTGGHVEYDWKIRDGIVIQNQNGLTSGWTLKWPADLLSVDYDGNPRIL
jgi:hypothetical protein